ncbi:MAG TPA: CPBP family glutamic-type intramembrane protease, partial [Nitrospiraceae bacterium]|nr:CPBP family glutamic-type intramembrane protease [Nitrospiraceae bacterium]
MRWIAAAELAAMSGLILSYIWIWQRTFPGSFLVCAAGYFGIGILGHRLRGESLQSIGVRFDNWMPAMRNAAVVVVIAVTATLIAGALLDSWHFPKWEVALLALPVSMIWATAQQYGLLCVFYRRSQDAFGNFAVAVFAAAGLFAVFHLPNSFLMAVTLVAGVAACVLYRYQPNIIVIGIAHALISFTLYHALPGKVTTNLRVGPGYLTIEADCQRNESIGKFTKGCANWRGVPYPQALKTIPVR